MIAGAVQPRLGWQDEGMPVWEMPPVSVAELAALGRARQVSRAGRVGLSWQRELAGAMRRGPRACGVPRPTWTAPLLARYLAEKTGVAVGERTVRRGLDLLGYVCRRP